MHGIPGGALQRPAYIDGPPDDHREDEAEGSELNELRGAAVKGRSPLGRGGGSFGYPAAECRKARQSFHGVQDSANQVGPARSFSTAIQLAM